MATVGLMTVSDCRQSVHNGIVDFATAVEDRIARSLVAAGHAVVRAQEPIWTNEFAVSEARRIADARPALTIVSIPVWAFPHFTMLAASETPGRCCCSPRSTRSTRGWSVCSQPAVASIRSAVSTDVSAGDIEDPRVRARVAAPVLAGAAVQGLRGSTFGRIGGRPMGMYTAIANPDQWIRQFGVDVEEIDQWELVRYSERVESSRGKAARACLEQSVAGVRYDGDRLTPAGFCTMDIAEAFLNDPYDWEGAKEPIVCSTEADMDAALTMQILKSLSATPVLFADVRHYHADLGVWDLCNSGQHATWFAARSADPLENLAKVHLYPEEFYFPAEGAAVHHLAAPGAFTFARLTRLDGRYRMRCSLRRIPPSRVVVGDLGEDHPAGHGHCRAVRGAVRALS